LEHAHACGSSSSSRPALTIMARDEAWLTAQLAVALGWDEALAEGVVDAIARAGSDAEVKSLVRVSVLCATRALACGASLLMRLCT
jgi:hypothetical protein